MSPRHRERGLSIVELMVGLAIGLTVIAAALLALTHHLRENRGLLVEARLMQDLRTASDLIARDLRRAGPLSVAEGGVRFAYPDTGASLAYRLRDGAIEMQIGEGHWQALTDVNTLRVAAFRITPHTEEIVLDGFCSQACAAGSTRCPPRQTVRSLALHIEARGAAPMAPLRSMETTVRLRHDALTGACPT
ncbi:MAG TPA: prepilin-type N-terminal cleavage/methylation domain-containing protein [Rhizobacter sp.]|nr:prepilin-type N-terminal cleavage/methylation domain-containing protein [Rhizobacter sp.]